MVSECWKQNDGAKKLHNELYIHVCSLRSTNPVLCDSQTALPKEQFGESLGEGLHACQREILLVQCWV